MPRRAGLQTANGVIVDEYLQASLPDIYAAGDIAFFPYQALGKQTRVEHWDNALNQGKRAGLNMAGAHKPYDYMPYFFSDLFEFGYEAVGEVDAQLETFADWQKENDTGVIYYLKDGKVRGRHDVQRLGQGPRCPGTHPESSFNDAGKPARCHPLVKDNALMRGSVDAVKQNPANRRTPERRRGPS